MHRLLFVYSDRYSAHPEVRTVLPSGAVVGTRRLVPKVAEGLLAVAQPQDIAASAALPHLGSAFVWPRGDGTCAVMQMWPVTGKGYIHARIICVDSECPVYFNSVHLHFLQGVLL